MSPSPADQSAYQAAIHQAEAAVRGSQPGKVLAPHLLPHVASFVGSLPGKLACSRTLKTTDPTRSEVLPLLQAVTQPWLCPNSPTHIHAIFVDVDHDDGLDRVEWMVRSGAPRPWLIVDPWSGRAHAALLLRVPVLQVERAHRKPIELAEATKAGLALALKASPLPAGGLMKNPFGLRSELAAPKVQRTPAPTNLDVWEAHEVLGDGGSDLLWHVVPGDGPALLYALLAGLQPWVREAEQKTRRSYAGRSSGGQDYAGRNEELHRVTVGWAMREDVRSGDEILHQAEATNTRFREPLSFKEVECTARSVARFMQRRWLGGAGKQSVVRGRDFQEGRDLTLKQKQILSGRNTALQRRERSRRQVEACLPTKSIQEVSRETGCSPSTVKRRRRDARLRKLGAQVGSNGVTG